VNPEQLSQLTKNYLLPSVPGETLTRVFALFTDSEFRPQELLYLLDTNPAFGHSILKQKLLAQKIAQWSQEDAKRTDQAIFLTKRVIGLLGKAAIRNLIASFRLARITNEGMPRKKDEDITLQPQQQIPFALKTEDFCQNMKWAFAEMSFVGGLHYDWLTALLASRKASDDTKKVLKDAYDEGFLTAQYAYKICQQIKGVRHDRFVFAAALVLPLGKALMASTFPKGGSSQAWTAAAAEWEKYGKLKTDAADHFENKLFQVTYPEMTALYVQAFSQIDLVGPAIRYALEPWLLLGGNRDQYQLAMILSTATTLIRSGALKPGEDLPLRDFQRKWLKQSGVKEKLLHKALTGMKK
jgi:hypothetical protein